MVSPGTPQKPEPEDSAVVNLKEGGKVTTKPKMTSGQHKVLKFESSLDHEDVDGRQELEHNALRDDGLKVIPPSPGAQKTTEQPQKPSAVDNHEARVTESCVQNVTQACHSKKDGDGVQCTEILGEGVLSQTNHKNAAELSKTENSLDHAEDTRPCENAKHNTGCVEQSIPPSAEGQCIKRSAPTCLCKECVENYVNLQEDLQEGSSEEDEKENEESMPLLRRGGAWVNSNFERSGSERSTSSSEEAANGCHDAQITLPYPDEYRPPDHITRLSNAGLYEQSEDPAGRSEAIDEEEAADVGCQVANPAFFVQHQQLEGSSESKRKNLHVQLEMCEKADIEKVEAEAEPLLRTHRSMSADEESVQARPGCCRCQRGCLKVVASFLVSLLVFPAFLYGAYAFLPFDAPLMPDIPTRLVYTLRCGIFASFPIVLGVIIHGISRLCASSFDPFKAPVREVTIHRRFVKQSTFLFVLYFFNLAVLATYLPQQYLKFIPLLTSLFAFSQLIYWLSFAVGRSFRGFGYGLTFLPLLSMLACNLYFMFILEPEKMIFLETGAKEASKSEQQRTSG
ncbi:transmembrane protein 79 [Ascaphus truei]|uniref:transmembrane protein 79 n=1 Tax=Ascaphus truei TaxID=8439 RepID=UPI003F5A5A01